MEEEDRHHTKNNYSKTLLESSPVLTVVNPFSSPNTQQLDLPHHEHPPASISPHKKQSSRLARLLLQDMNEADEHIL